MTGEREKGTKMKNMKKIKKMKKVKDMYITIAGTSHYFGTEFMKKGMKVKLVKEPDNKHDREAIKVKMAGLDKVGYVANSPYTVLGECMSAGRLYDRIGDEAEAEILYVLPQGVVCIVNTADDKESAGVEKRMPL